MVYIVIAKCMHTFSWTNDSTVQYNRRQLS